MCQWSVYHNFLLTPKKMQHRRTFALCHFLPLSFHFVCADFDPDSCPGLCVSCGHAPIRSTVFVFVATSCCFAPLPAQQVCSYSKLELSLDRYSSRSRAYPLGSMSPIVRSRNHHSNRCPRLAQNGIIVRIGCTTS